MKFLIHVLVLSFYSIIGIAQEKEDNSIVTNATLNNVTIYKMGAELKHNVKVNLNQGSWELIVNNVASTIDENSIQVNAPSNITIMSVVMAKDYKKKDKSVLENPLYKQKEIEIKSAEKALQKIRNQKDAAEKTLGMLARNEDIKAANGNTNLSTEELNKMATYYLNKQVELKNLISDLIDQEKEQWENIQKMQTQLGKFGNNGIQTGGQLIIQVMTNTPVQNGIISFSYISRNAGWAATYDLKADKTSDPLKILYKANVVQNTGLDWKQVKLTLSTANPSLGSNAPILNAWFLRYGTPARVKQKATANTIQSFNEGNYAMEQMNQSVYGQKLDRRSYTGALSTVSSDDIQRRPESALNEVMLRGSGSLSSNISPLIVIDGAPYSGDLSFINQKEIANIERLDAASAKSLYGSRGENGVLLITTKKGDGVSAFTSVEEKELNITFDIDIPYNIASNAKPHNVSLKEFKVPVSYKYYAVPKLDPDAFLMAEVTDYEELNLIPGEANIIFENTYVGKTFLNPYNTKDTLDLSMGRDKRVAIKREQIADNNGVKLMGSNRKQTFTYEITLKNNKKEAVDLLLKDQYPIGTDNNMEVELLSSDNAANNKETGILTWKIKLNPGESKKVRFSYSVKYPKDKIMSNL